jgi:hypothetical protein
LGQKGRKYILQRFSRAGTAEKYIDVLEALIRNPQLKPRSK